MSYSLKRWNSEVFQHVHNLENAISILDFVLLLPFLEYRKGL